MEFFWLVGLGFVFNFAKLVLLFFRNLYPKFASPWASSPCRPQDIGNREITISFNINICKFYSFTCLNSFINSDSFLDFHVPSEYLTNIHIRDKVSMCVCVYFLLIYYSNFLDFLLDG